MKKIICFLALLNVGCVGIPSPTYEMTTFSAGVDSYQKNTNVSIWTNKFDPSATQIDFEKITAKCKYESSMATVDTSRKNPSRITLPTGNLNVMAAQEHAKVMDDVNDTLHETGLSLMKANLYGQCLEASGYVSKTISENEITDQIRAKCPKFGLGAEPCFIPGQ